jgi:hypothetical protein
MQRTTYTPSPQGSQAENQAPKHCDNMPPTEPVEDAWVLPPTELDWRKNHSGHLSLIDAPFDIRSGVSDSIVQLIGEHHASMHQWCTAPIPSYLSTKQMVST